MSTELLHVENLQSGYGEITVLWDVNLDIREGEITALVGSNGAGKSTLMRTLSGLITPTSGRTVWRGREIQALDCTDILRAGIAHVPEGRRLFSAMRVEDNLLMGAYLRSNSKGEITRSLDRVYGIFPKLRDRRTQHAGTLSGGEQQMCAIGRGLMSDPQLLMIDELSLGLSPLLVEQLIEALQALNRDGLTVLIVEQDVVAALEVSHSAYVMDTGRIVQHGASAALLVDPSIRQAYLGSMAGR